MQVEAYVIFERDAAADKAATKEKLRSTSLQMCKQLIVGDHDQDVFVHLNCTENGDSKNLNAAVTELSKVKGISRTIGVLKR
jgi:hypothetical protein